MERVGNIIYRDHYLKVIKNYFLKFYLLDQYITADTAGVEEPNGKPLDDLISLYYDAFVNYLPFNLRDIDCVYIAMLAALDSNIELLESLKIDNSVLSAYIKFSKFIQEHFFELFGHSYPTSEDKKEVYLGGEDTLC